MVLSPKTNCKHLAKKYRIRKIRKIAKIEIKSLKGYIN